jgi:glycosyltransferase involved in cell wall biosynthesis
VVTTGVGGLADAVEDGITGVVVPVRDAAALRVALEALLADANERVRLGGAAREKARAAFSFEAAMHAMTALYLGLL